MVAIGPLFFVLCASCAYLVQETSGLLCYECNSSDHPECEYLGRRNSSRYLFPCYAGYKPDDVVTEYRRALCRKQTQEINLHGINRKHIVRSCGWVLHKNSDENTCYKVKSIHTKEITCQCFEDACNSAWSTSGKLFLIFILFCVTNSVHFG